MTMPAAMKTGLSQGQQLGQETQEEILEALEKKRAHIANMEIVLNGPRSFRHDVDKKGPGEEEDPVILPKRKDIRKETER